MLYFMDSFSLVITSTKKITVRAAVNKMKDINTTTKMKMSRPPAMLSGKLLCWNEPGVESRSMVHDNKGWNRNSGDIYTLANVTTGIITSQMN